MSHLHSRRRTLFRGLMACSFLASLLVSAAPARPLEAADCVYQVGSAISIDSTLTKKRITVSFGIKCSRSGYNYRSEGGLWINGSYQGGCYGPQKGPGQWSTCTVTGKWFVLKNSYWTEAVTLADRRVGSGSWSLYQRWYYANWW
jgi:hypothetical protein